jgi:hypothetical protein
MPIKTGAILPPVTGKPPTGRIVIVGEAALKDTTAVF